jgi:hypothetical protein
MGVVTLGGDPAGVSVGGERRLLPVYSPGGYSWRPAAGDRVLVLKAGGERESPCILGAVQQDSGALKPGEVALSGGGSQLRLGQDGIQLTGQVLVNGESLEALVRRVAAGLLQGTEG